MQDDPIKKFLSWFKKAAKKEKFPDAVSLATCFKNKPSVRTMLFKGIGENKFRLFTNFQSRKMLEMEKNPHAALCFFWQSLYLQVRVEGKIKKISQKESEKYFYSRPRDSQISALISPQSEKIKSFSQLKKDFLRMQKNLEGKKVLMPSHWGGFALDPTRIEFWIGSTFRLHQRIVYEKLKSGGWKKFEVGP